MQNNDLDELLKSAVKLEDGFDIEIYVSPKTRKAKILNAAYVLAAFCLLGLMVGLPFWWGRLACGLVFILSAYSFDREARIHWR